MPSSRLLCGLTWGGNGSWTSWPPHQHEKDLEEVYCYFDMDAPKFGLHLSYLKSGEVEDVVAEQMLDGKLQSGDTAHVRLKDGLPRQPEYLSLGTGGPLPPQPSL